MQRVTRPSAYAVQQAPPASPGTPGHFGPGDPVAGVPATVPGYEWHESVQEELIAVQDGAGLTAAGGTLTQVRQAILRLAGGNVASLTAGATLTADSAGVVHIAISANATFILPAANAAGGKPIRLTLVRTDTAAFTATVQRAGTDTIEGATTTTVPVGGRTTLVSDGVSAWRVASEAVWGRSIGANGYTRLPGGLIMQWGAVARAARVLSASATVTFPLAFPNACFAVIPSIDYDNAGLLDMSAGADAPTTTGVTLLAGTHIGTGEGVENRTFGWRWLAIGN